MRMFEIIETSEYWSWFDALRDVDARTSIDARLKRLAIGHFGDCRPVGGGVFELRIHCGPGYRVYFVRHGATVIVLLAGGDKSSQLRDIERVKRLAQDVLEERAWKD
jgi:putative addiction module killer protein